MEEFEDFDKEIKIGEVFDVDAEVEEHITMPQVRCYSCNNANISRISKKEIIKRMKEEPTDEKDIQLVSKKVRSFAQMLIERNEEMENLLQKDKELPKTRDVEALRRTFKIMSDEDMQKKLTQYENGLIFNIVMNKMGIKRPCCRVAILNPNRLAEGMAYDTRTVYDYKTDKYVTLVPSASVIAGNQEDFTRRDANADFDLREGTYITPRKLPAR